jgi:murein DD-endopeptidase MepM/ murein hydrolase activator NlpD
VERGRLQAGAVLLAGAALVGAAFALSGGGDGSAAPAPAPTSSVADDPAAGDATTDSATGVSTAAPAVASDGAAAVAAAPVPEGSDGVGYAEEVLDQVELDQATVPVNTAEQPSRPVNVPLGDQRSCPLGGPFDHWFDWLAPRRGGKSHLGHDLIAPTGTPVLAVSDAFVVRVDREDRFDGGMRDTQGVALAIVTAQGERFFYAHLAAIAPQLQPGSPVVTGQVIGWVGKTGDAQLSVPHLHIEWRPDGRIHADPQPLVSELCANPVG